MIVENSQLKIFVSRNLFLKGGKSPPTLFPFTTLFYFYDGQKIKEYAQTAGSLNLLTKI